MHRDPTVHGPAWSIRSVSIDFIESRHRSPHYYHHHSTHTHTHHPPTTHTHLRRLHIGQDAAQQALSLIQPPLLQQHLSQPAPPPHAAGRGAHALRGGHGGSSAGAPVGCRAARGAHAASPGHTRRGPGQTSLHCCTCHLSRSTPGPTCDSMISREFSMSATALARAPCCHRTSARWSIVLEVSLRAREGWGKCCGGRRVVGLFEVGSGARTARGGSWTAASLSRQPSISATPTFCVLPASQPCPQPTCAPCPAPPASSSEPARSTRPPAPAGAAGSGGRAAGGARGAQATDAQHAGATASLVLSCTWHTAHPFIPAAHARIHTHTCER